MKVKKVTKQVARHTSNTDKKPTLNTGKKPTLNTDKKPTLNTGKNPTLNTGKNPTLNTGKKTVSKPISNVIKLENNTDDFDLKQDDIYFVKSDSCFFCKMMLPEWNKAKTENKNIKIYEIERKYLDKYPKISVYVESYPTLLRYHNNDFFEFNKERTVENLSKFLKI